MSYNHYGYEPGDRKGAVKEGAKVFGLSVGAFIATILVVLLAGTAVMFATGTVQRWTANWRGETAQIEKVKADPNYRIANYERFYDRAAAIEALEVKACAMKVNTSLPEDQRETNVLALENQRITLVTQYNADARKNDTRANYLASDLPYEFQMEYTCR